MFAEGPTIRRKTVRESMMAGDEESNDRIGPEKPYSLIVCVLMTYGD
jgi:hypothetical protein